MNRLKAIYHQLNAAFIMFKGLGIKNTKLIFHYLMGKLFIEDSDDVHLDHAMKWLCLSQDIVRGKGSAAQYIIEKGWDGPYPETSGYIIPTFLVYAKYFGDSKYVQRAIQIGNWEIDIQTSGGGILSNVQSSATRVFNTGQVILGWCALFEQTGDKKYLMAAVKAGNYLLNEQEKDGTWRKDTHCGARTYHARVDWALLRLYILTGDSRFSESARKNIMWIVDQQKENGWFNNCGFGSEDPITHVIVYTLRGLLECYLTNVPEINKLDLLPKIIKSANSLCSTVDNNSINGIIGMLPTSFDEEWKSKDNHSCLTGNAQFAYFLYKLAQTTGNEYYKTKADEVVRSTKQTQNINTSIIEIKGAISGSFPLYNGYLNNRFPNWATKFYADALMMKILFNQKISISA
jgi:uncharacterized protein YyaL (SSP411 family)